MAQDYHLGTPSYDRLSWERADRFAIDMGGGAWNAGHVNALVAAGGELLVGSDTGGVWLATGDDASPVWLPVSDDWANPDVQCLAVDPTDPRRVVAGCRQRDGSSPEPAYAELLYETATSAPEPHRAWAPVRVPAGFGTVWAIQISASPHALVCATGSGVWWLSLAVTLRTSPRAQWVKASSYSCTGLVLGPGGSPVASSAAGGHILVGSWQTAPAGPRLTFTTATVSPSLPGNLGRSSLAASVDGRTMYLIAADSAGHQGAFAMSASAGRTWSSWDPEHVAEHLEHLIADQIAGGQGSYNNCIGVSPSNPSIVAVGWQSGTFLSTDGGRQFAGTSGGDHLHADVHAVYFDPRDPKGSTLHVGSDGGIASTTDLGMTWSSERSKTLRNLQPTGFPERNNYGATFPHPTFAGVVAGGWKDNGTGALRVTGEWVKGPDAGGDGAAGAFLADGALLYCFVAWGGAGIPAHLATWDAVAGTSSAWSRPAVVNSDGSRLDGLDDPVIAPVPVPSFVHPRFPDGKVMRAVGGFGQQSNIVYGLFYGTDVTAAEWRELAALSPPQTATWSYRVAADGHSVYVGCATPAQVVCVDASTSTITTLADPAIAAGLASGSAATVTHLELTAAGLFAVVLTGPTSVLLLMTAPPHGAWTRLGTGLPPVGVAGAVPFPSAVIYGLAVDPWNGIFVATESKVLRSSDSGGTWFDASAGLPAMPHCADLRAVSHPRGGVTYYLSSWGRSLWQAAFLPRVPDASSVTHVGWNDLIGSLADGRVWVLGRKGPEPTGGDPLGRQASTQLANGFVNLVGQIASLGSTVSAVSDDLRARTAADPALLSRDVAAGIATLAELRTLMAGSADVLAERVHGQPTAVQLRRVASATAALRRATDEARSVISDVGPVAAKISPSATALGHTGDAVHAAIASLDRLTAGAGFTPK